MYWTWQIPSELKNWIGNAKNVFLVDTGMNILTRTIVKNSGTIKHTNWIEISWLFRHRDECQKMFEIQTWDWMREVIWMKLEDHWQTKVVFIIWSNFINQRQVLCDAYQENQDENSKIYVSAIAGSYVSSYPNDIHSIFFSLSTA